MTPFISSTSPASLGHRLEHERIEHRARRVRLVLAALQDRAVLRSRDGVVPPPLQEAIRGFHTELRTLNQRLSDAGEQPQQNGAG